MLTVELAACGGGFQDGSPHLLHAHAAGQADVCLGRVGEESLQVLVQLIQVPVCDDCCVEYCSRHDRQGGTGGKD